MLALLWGHGGCRDSVCPLPRYAMKCLDKKRIKMKQGETLALNERIMLSLVSTGVRGHGCWAGDRGQGMGTREGDPVSPARTAHSSCACPTPSTRPTSSASSSTS